MFDNASLIELMFNMFVRKKQLLCVEKTRLIKNDTKVIEKVSFTSVINAIEISNNRSRYTTQTADGIKRMIDKTTFANKIEE